MFKLRVFFGCDKYATEPKILFLLIFYNCLYFICLNKHMRLNDCKNLEEDIFNLIVYNKTCKINLKNINHHKKCCLGVFFR